MSEVVESVEKLSPRPGDVVALHLTENADGPELAALSEQLRVIADRTRATMLLLPAGVSLDLIDEREMLVRGWIRVGPLAHTTVQLAEPSAPSPADHPSGSTTELNRR